MSEQAAAPLLEMRGIRKRFPGALALDGVDLRVARGEVVALVGENGAGKSTLMKILGGVYQPDAGEIRIEGRSVRIPTVHAAIRLGIGLIHQELNVLDNLDVAANVFLGREPVNALRLVDRRRLEADTLPLLARLGLAVAPDTRLDALSLAQQQMVEIAKTLSLEARLIIMDEPTSSLTLSETDRLLELVRELAGQGMAVVYISHRLAEIDRCADRVVVLRDGRNAGELSRAEATHDRVVGLMVGREIKSFYVDSKAATVPGYFRVRGARSRRYPRQAVSFDAARGEILGFAGLAGAGRSEIAQAIVGLEGPGDAEVWLADQRVRVGSPRDAIKHGIYLVPEDRRRQGLVVSLSVRENISLPSLFANGRLGLVRRDRERRAAEGQIAALGIKTPDCETPVVNLSGGNQQKVVLGKWLAMQPKVIILDEPTRGIDVGAKAEIYRLMRALAEEGAVLLMISSDMEEVLHVSDRVAVMHEGRIGGILERRHCSEENIMQLAVGRPVAAASPAVAS